MRLDGSGKCPGYTLESQEHFVFRGHAGPDCGPSDHLPSVAETPCPPAPVLSEATSLQSRQPGSSSIVRSPLPSLSDYCRTFWFPSPAFSFSPSPHSLMICLSLGHPTAGAGSFPQGSGGLVGRRVLAPRGHSCWPVLSLLPPSCSPQACSSPSPPLPLAGPLSSQDHSRVTLPARGKGGSFTSLSSHVHPTLCPRSPGPLLGSRYVSREDEQRDAEGQQRQGGHGCA